MHRNRIKSTLVVGDLHLSDTHKGRHKNYIRQCFLVMRDILDYVEKNKIQCVIFAGDIVGVREKNIKMRQVLLVVCNFFKNLNIATNGNVYCVRGNHDFGQNPEFDFLHGLGLIKTTEDSQYVDMIGETGVVNLRFHLVNYGDEKKSIELCNEVNSENVVVFHNNMMIKDQTTWYPVQKGYELSQMDNWSGCSLAIGGHIHKPSPYIAETKIGDTQIQLLYLGCPTRPTYDTYKKVWLAEFKENSDGDIEFNTIGVELEPEEEVFFSQKVVEDMTDDELAEKLRKEDLDELLKDLMQYRIADGDPLQMLDTLPGTKPRAVSIAKQYINLAYTQIATKQK